MLLLGLGVLSGCHSLSERLEVEQLLVPPGGGFGRRARGDAAVENYLSFGDTVIITLDPSMVGYAMQDEQLSLLAMPQPVAIDGTIFLPVIGRLAVQGLTETQLESLIEHRLSTYYTMKVDLSVRIRTNILSKTIFVYGEVETKGAVPLARIRLGDVTVMDVISRLRPTMVANLGRVKVIRCDPRNPLVVEVNVREMFTSGISTYNIQIKEDDIIYVPPTFLGTIGRFVERITYPFQSLIRTAVGFGQIGWSYRWMRNDDYGIF